MMSSSRPHINWLTIGQMAPTVPDGGIDVLVNKDATNLMSCLGQKRINLISIFGSAREGKSTFMNMLAGVSSIEDELFKSGDDWLPITKGVDLSRIFLSLEEFSGLNGNEKVTADIEVGFVDTEGQGDRGDAYDIAIFSPILIASKVTIFWWRGGYAQSDILFKLGAMTKSAERIYPENGDTKNYGILFGHLHIIFRDYINTDSKTIKDHLMMPESNDEKDAMTRNFIRKMLTTAFESINVWIFPKSNCNKDRVLYDDFQVQWQSQFRELRKKFSEQMKEPKKVGRVPLTGAHISTLTDELCRNLARGKQHSIAPVFEQMQLDEATKAMEIYKSAVATAVDERWADETPMTKSQLDAWFEKVNDDHRRAFDDHVADLPGHVTKPLLVAMDASKADKFNKIEERNKAHVLQFTSSAYSRARERIDIRGRELAATMPIKELRLLEQWNEFTESCCCSYNEKVIPFVDIISNSDQNFESLQSHAKDTFKDLQNRNQQMERAYMDRTCHMTYEVFGFSILALLLAIFGIWWLHESGRVNGLRQMINIHKDSDTIFATGFQMLESEGADFVKQNFHPNVAAIILNPGKEFSIYNEHQSEYLYAADNYFCVDEYRRRVFTWRPKYQVLQGSWKFLPQANGKTFMILNQRHQEYLYVSNGRDSKDNFDSDRKYVFTDRKGGASGGEKSWKLVPYNGGDKFLITNDEYGQYMYAADYSPYDNDRRWVFMWKEGGKVSQGKWKIKKM